MAERENTMDNSYDSETILVQPGKNKKGKQNSEFFHSIYSKPLQATYWCCCKKFQKAPLLIITILLIIDLVRFIPSAILTFETDYLSLLFFANTLVAISCIVVTIFAWGIRKQNLTAWGVLIYSIVRIICLLINFFYVGLFTLSVVARSIEISTFFGGLFSMMTAIFIVTVLVETYYVINSVFLFKAARILQQVDLVNRGAADLYTGVIN